MLSADRAAFEYNLGDCIAIRGDLRGVNAPCYPVGSSVGGIASVGAGVDVGVALGSHAVGSCVVCVVDVRMGLFA